jgi:hypothetical protein
MSAEQIASRFTPPSPRYCKSELTYSATSHPRGPRHTYPPRPDAAHQCLSWIQLDLLQFRQA